LITVDVCQYSTERVLAHGVMKRLVATSTVWPARCCANAYWSKGSK
jgi:hypothetical protein